MEGCIVIVIKVNTVRSTDAIPLFAFGCRVQLYLMCDRTLL